MISRSNIVVTLDSSTERFVGVAIQMRSTAMPFELRKRYHKYVPVAIRDEYVEPGRHTTIAITRSAHTKSTLNQFDTLRQSAFSRH